MSNYQEDYSDEFSRKSQELANKAKGSAKSVARNIGKKSLKNVGNKVKKLASKGIKELVKVILTSISGWIIVIIIVIVVCVILFEYSTKEGVYFLDGQVENSVEVESTEVYVKNDNGSTYDGNKNSGNTIIRYDKKIKKNEQNQAIENYHKFRAMDAEYRNKYYYPLKGFEENTNKNEVYNKLIKEGMIELEGNAGFISSPTLSDFKSNWKTSYNVEKFNWTKSIAGIDKTINDGARLIGFKEEAIGDLKRAELDDSKKEKEMTDKEKKKLEKQRTIIESLKDTWNRESYFRLPPELLVSLNQMMYDYDIIYSKPFVQPVKFERMKKKYKPNEGKSEKKDKEMKEKKEVHDSLFEGVPNTLTVDQVEANVANGVGKTDNKGVTKKNSKKLIFIDAGHGGRDNGASGFGLNEDDKALEIANKLGTLLEEAGYKIEYARKNDSFVKINDRYRMANSKNADLFISIHLNSSTSKKADGIEVLYKEDARKSSVFADTIQNSIIYSVGGKNRGTKLRTDLGVLNGSRMPAVLVECGFISNEKENNKLRSKVYIEGVCKGIVDGVEKYLSKNTPIKLNGSVGESQSVNLGKIKTGIPDYYYQTDHVGVGSKHEGNFGLGTVYVYRPSVRIKLKKGVQVSQILECKSKTNTTSNWVNVNKNVKSGKESGVENKLGQKQDIEVKVYKPKGADKNRKKVETKTTTYWYEPKASGTPIHEVEAEVVYVLDKAITFANVYNFEYEVEQKELDSKYAVQEGAVQINKDGEEVSEVEYEEYKEIEYKEMPSNLELVSATDKMYLESFIKNFETSMPADVKTSFTIQNLVEAFRGDLYSIAFKGSSMSGGAAGEASASVEKWRALAEEIGAKWGVDPAILLTLIDAESTGNLHIADQGPRGHIGLVQMSPENFQSYFTKDQEYKNYKAEDRIPKRTHSGSCNINDPEHERVARFNIEYLARRISAQMGLFLHFFANVDATKDEIPYEELQKALLFTTAAYNSGEYGQLALYAYHRNDTKLYSSPGKYYEDMFVRHSTEPIPLTGSLKKYIGGPSSLKMLNPGSNRTYLSKMYKFYPKYSGGVAMEEAASVNFDKFDPKKWFVHPSMPGNKQNDLSGGISSSYSGAGMNSESVQAYMKFENEGSYRKGNMIAYAKSNKEVNAKEILQYAQAYMENKSTFDVDENEIGYSYWSNGYDETYFQKGRPVRPPAGEEMSEKIYTGEIVQKKYNGSVEDLYDTAAMFGKQVYKIVKGGVEQIRKPYVTNASGPGMYDSPGLVWYVLNVKGAVKVELKDVKGYYEFFNKEVGQGELKPGDIIFYKDRIKGENIPIDMGIYLGNDTALVVDKKLGVKMVKSSTYKGENDSLEYLSGRRVLQHGGGEAKTVNESIGGFGQLPADMLKGEWAHPLGNYQKKVSSRFGWRRNPFTGKGIEFHKGEDMPAPTGTPVYATKKGMVQEARVFNGYGNGVILKHDNGYTTLYGHMTRFVVRRGQAVEKGQIIGFVGSTGMSSGPHLHFEIAKDYPIHLQGPKAEYPEGPYLDPKKVLNLS